MHDEPMAAALGGDKSGLAAALRAQLYSTGFVAVGDPQAGFVERGTSGSYGVVLSVPDGFTGFVDVYDTSDPADVLAGGAITPGVDPQTLGDGLLDLADAVEAGVTPRAAFRAVCAVLAGLLPGGAGTGTEAFFGIGQPGTGTPRVVNTVDDVGNRTAQELHLG